MDTDKREGIYRKYDVKRVHDPKGKHKNCTYFVLDLDHDKFAWTALRAYSDACESEFPELAKDIRAWLLYERTRVKQEDGLVPQWMVRLHSGKPSAQAAGKDGGR